MNKASEARSKDLGHVASNEVRNSVEQLGGSIAKRLDPKVGQRKMMSWVKWGVCNFPKIALVPPCIGTSMTQKETCAKNA